MTKAKAGAASAAAPAASFDPAAAAALRDLVPDLSPVDVFRGVIVVTFGDQRYELAALSMEEDERWVAGLDQGMQFLLHGVRAGEQDPQALLAMLMTATPRMLDAVYAYDRDGVLPPLEELRRQARSIDVLRAAMTIWVATNPTLAAALAVQAAVTKRETNGTSSAPSSSSPRPTAGRRGRSAGS